MYMYLNVSSEVKCISLAFSSPTEYREKLRMEKEKSAAVVSCTETDPSGGESAPRNKEGTGDGTSEMLHHNPVVATSTMPKESTPYKAVEKNCDTIDQTSGTITDRYVTAITKAITVTQATLSRSMINSTSLKHTVLSSQSRVGVRTSPRLAAAVALSQNVLSSSSGAPDTSLTSIPSLGKKKRLSPCISEKKDVAELFFKESHLSVCDGDRLPDLFCSSENGPDSKLSVDSKSTSKPSSFLGLPARAAAPTTGERTEQHSRQDDKEAVKKLQASPEGMMTRRRSSLNKRKPSALIDSNSPVCKQPRIIETGMVCMQVNDCNSNFRLTHWVFS